jgi:hypothetical protein
VRPLDDPRPLHLGEHADEREHRAADRRREVERLAQRHEPDAQVLQLVE